jgi:hypothetical protein
MTTVSEVAKTKSGADPEAPALEVQKSPLSWEDSEENPRNWSENKVFAMLCIMLYYF